MKNKNKITLLNKQEIEKQKGTFLKINWNKNSIHFLDSKGTKRVNGLIGLPIK